MVNTGDSTLTIGADLGDSLVITLENEGLINGDFYAAGDHAMTTGPDTNFNVDDGGQTALIHWVAA